MSCDLCGRKCAPYELVQLLVSYRTREIEWICPECEKEASRQIEAIKDLSRRWYCRTFKAWLRNKKIRRYAR